MVAGVRAAAWAAVLAAGLGVACSDGRTARDAGVRYGCAAAVDCLDGFSCVCGLCTPAGATPICVDGTGADNMAGPDTGGDVIVLADSAPDIASDAGADTGGPADAVAEVPDAADVSLSPDAAAQDVDTGPPQHTGACNLVDWKPCVGARGCYYATSTKVTFCAAHGAGAEGAPCDPSAAPACGRASDGTPLVCDTIDKKCYRTCACLPVSPTACPKGKQCYCLKAAGGAAFPGDAGICAP